MAASTCIPPWFSLATYPQLPWPVRTCGALGRGRLPPLRLPRRPAAHAVARGRRLRRCEGLGYPHILICATVEGVIMSDACQCGTIRLSRHCLLLLYL